MAQKLNRYIRAYRKQAGLTQSDVGALLGYAGGEQVSRLERSIEAPSIATALLLALIFDQPIRRLLPGMRRRLRGYLMTRARQRLQLLDAAPSTARTAQRQAFLHMLTDGGGGEPAKAYEGNLFSDTTCWCGCHEAGATTTESPDS